MDSNLIYLAVSGGLTLLGLILVLVLWRFAKLRTSLWWLGFALLPIAVYLLGLVPTVIDFWNALVTWWAAVSPGMSTTLIAGLAVGGLGVALMLVSRVIPYRTRRKRDEGTGVADPATPIRTRPVYEPAPVSQSTPPEPTAEPGPN